MGLSTEIDRITNMVLIGGAAVFLLVLVGSLLFYIGFKRKRRVKMEDIQTDYSMLKRMDSVDYLKFDDILDDMIIADHGTRFIAVISCKGFEFFSAHITDRINTQNGYRSFIGTILSILGHIKSKLPIRNIFSFSHRKIIGISILLFFKKIRCIR